MFPIDKKNRDVEVPLSRIAEYKQVVQAAACVCVFFSGSLGRKPLRVTFLLTSNKRWTKEWKIIWGAWGLFKHQTRKPNP